MKTKVHGNEGGSSPSQIKRWGNLSPRITGRNLLFNVIFTTTIKVQTWSSPDRRRRERENSGTLVTHLFRSGRPTSYSFEHPSFQASSRQWVSVRTFTQYNLVSRGHLDGLLSSVLTGVLLVVSLSGRLGSGLTTGCLNTPF